MLQDVDVSSQLLDFARVRQQLPALEAEAEDDGHKGGHAQDRASARSREPRSVEPLLEVGVRDAQVLPREVQERPRLLLRGRVPHQLLLHPRRVALFPGQHGRHRADRTNPRRGELLRFVRIGRESICSYASSRFGRTTCGEDNSSRIDFTTRQEIILLARLACRWKISLSSSSVLPPFEEFFFHWKLEDAIQRLHLHLNSDILVCLTFTYREFIHMSWKRNIVPQGKRIRLI